MTTPIGEGAQSGAEGTQSGAGENTGTGGTDNSQDTGTAQSGGENSGTTTDDKVSRSELDSVLARMRAADQRADKAQQELKQLRDKDLPEAEKLKRDYEESQAQVQKLQETNTALALKVAFLSDNTYTWHNPERALKLVDLSQVEVDAEGNVRGLKDALKALATSDAYLIKQEAKEEPKQPAGTAPGNNGSSGTGKPGTKGMAVRVPALNTRIKS
jgi:Phage minor structural protein GP20